MFVLNSEITIGSFQFTALNEVVVKRSIHSIVETATISIPAISSIVKNGKASPERVSTANQFKEGDAVVIRLGYNGALETEFRGFVRQRKLGMPLEIECEGYSWLLRRNKVRLKNATYKLKDLLAAAVKGVAGGYKIQVQCDLDIELSNPNIVNPSGFDIINYISRATDGNVSCFFIAPDMLWCGLLYTSLAGGSPFTSAEPVSYRIGYNALKQHSLIPHDINAAPGIVEYRRRYPDGVKISYESKGAGLNISRHSRLLNQVAEPVDLKVLAEERSKHNSYTGYEGRFTTFLQPYAAPAYQAYITDAVHPELDGTYLVESTEVRFGTGGARRIIEPGARIET
jgi:hypothetical protein